MSESPQSYRADANTAAGTAEGYLAEAIRATLQRLSAQTNSPIDRDLHQSLLRFAASHRGSKLTDPNLAAELVAAIIEARFQQPRLQKALRRFSAEVADFLLQTPSTRDHLESVWQRYSELIGTSRP